jgi:uncharacterized membrane protein SpoIIM required for sporulation
MIRRYGPAFEVILVIAGIWWCKEIIARWSDDVETLRKSQVGADKVVVLFYWATAVVASIVVVYLSVGIVRQVISFVAN